MDQLSAAISFLATLACAAVQMETKKSRGHYELVLSAFEYNSFLKRPAAKGVLALPLISTNKDLKQTIPEAARAINEA